MVIDAKYKPHYHNGELDIEDVRQVSAYARMEGVYKKTGNYILVVPKPNIRKNDVAKKP